MGFDCSICNREATWTFVPGSGGDWSVKLGSHGGGSDNGSLIELGNVDVDGGGGNWRCEGPHMTYADVSGGTGSAPGIGGSQQVSVKAVTWSTGADTVHHEVWLDPSGSGTNWGEGPIATFDGSAEGCNAITCPVPSGEDDAHCQDTLRIDENSGHEFISHSFYEIVPEQRATGGTAPPTTTTTPPPPPTTTPPPAEEEEPEEEEEEDEEEDSGDDGDGDGDGENAEEFDEDSPEAREQNERISNCSGLTGETYRACASAAQTNRRRSGSRRTGNLARRGPLTRAMLSAYYFPRLRTSRRFRIGNVR